MEPPPFQAAVAIAYKYAHAWHETLEQVAKIS